MQNQQPSHGLSAAQVQAGSGRQLPEQLLSQQQQQVKVHCRRRPTADAAGLALQGRAAQEGSEQARMTQSGPLQQGPSGPALLPVPELFEVQLSFPVHVLEIHLLWLVHRLHNGKL